MNSVQIKVAEQIANLAPSVEASVVDALVDREKNRRADALVCAMDNLSRLEAALNKLRPDQVSFDEKGTKISETFSKGRLEEINKQKGKIDKLTKAINKALEKADFGDVYNFAKSGNIEEIE